jgi:hypothetical protein
MKLGKTIPKRIAVFILITGFGMGSANADQVSVSVSPASPYTDVWVNSGGGAYQIDVDANGGDPVVQLYSDFAPSEFNSLPEADPANHVAEDDDGGLGLSSLLIGNLGAGNYTIRVTSFAYWIDQPSSTATYTLTYTGLNSGRRASGNSLRLDKAGTITENSNVVSCTPGTYTFLNGGSTPETANIQSYVYTLLVNGKAVSTLSTDGFRSVPTHLFPTIAGNMAGTATLTSATWDLKGMSNYSATCQVYAVQSNGNTQALTNTVYDSVAIAEANAKAQAWEDQRSTATAANFTKDMREMRKRLAARQP